MSALWTVAEVLAATGGRAVNVTDGELTAISIDSREIEPGSLFVAIKGDVHDGHAFVAKALEQGAGAALVSEAKAADLPQDRLIVVPDALLGLEKLAVAARARSGAKIVAVTGSAGKTTAKEMIRTVLSAWGRTHWSIKSFNNHWGVPLMLARMPRDAEYGVFEIGMNHAGEITPLTRMVRPHVAVITTVAAAHLEFFDSVAGIARAKAEIFLGLEPGATAVLNADHEHLGVLLDRARDVGVSTIVTYGFSEGADWRISTLEESSEATTVRVQEAAVKAPEAPFRLQIGGRHMAANAVAALVVADLFGVPPGTAIAALERFEAPEGRGLTARLGPAENPLLLVDQSYNANMASMAATLSVFASQTPPNGQKVLILGDMLEMGPQGPALHASLKDAVLATGATRIFLVGPVMANLAETLGKSRVTGHANDINDLQDTILASLAYGDAVMVKGSKGVRLAGLVKAIREKFA
jgi:UDP-N-acetylmuramoyl-tripeptide--D-alanyl-D-alanine ligase